MYMIGYCVREFGRKHAVGWSIAILGWVLLATGVVVMSTIPHEEFDFDRCGQLGGGCRANKGGDET